jgi:two-component system response regulator AlgR
MKQLEDGRIVLSVLVVDDESLARSRLRTLLADCHHPPAECVGEAENAVQAMHFLQHHAVDVALIDIHMPGLDGLGLVQAMKNQPHPPAVVFVTAHTEHAVQAFELDVLDYLTKPVRRERLQAALHKAERLMQLQQASQPMGMPEEVVVLHDRGRTERLPLREVIYFKAEMKYITVCTASRCAILDGALNDLEAQYKADFIRIHRNALVAKRALRALLKHWNAEDGESWTVQLHGTPDQLTVSRRQLAHVRELLGQG